MNSKVLSTSYSITYVQHNENIQFFGSKNLKINLLQRCWLGSQFSRSFDCYLQVSKLRESDKFETESLRSEKFEMLRILNSIMAR